MSPSQSSLSKRIGEVLVEANLLTSAQLQVALYDQQQFSTMRLGEIFVFRGWLNQQTADFFGDRWFKICTLEPSNRQSLGEYLYAAGLVDQQSIQQIIEEQHRNGYRFGANAVLLGFIQQRTLDYFLENIFPDKKNEGHYIFNGKQRIIHPQEQVIAEIAQAQKDNRNSSTAKLKVNKYQEPKFNIDPVDDEISWVG